MKRFLLVTCHLSLVTLLFACSASRPVYPTQTADESRWKQEYADGKITWSEYQSLLAGEKPSTVEAGP